MSRAMYHRVFRLKPSSPSTSILNSLSSLLPKHEILIDLGSLDRAEPLLQPEGCTNFSNLLVRYLSVPWDSAKPFLLQILMNMTKGILFVEPPPCSHSLYRSPASLLRDLAEVVRRHSFRLSCDVRVVMLVRSGIVEHMSRKISIPQFIELEKLHLEMELSSFCGAGFIEDESLRMPSEAICLEEAIRSRRSVLSILQEKAQWKDSNFCTRIQKVHQLENMYLADPKRVSENSSFTKLLEDIFPL